MNGCAHSAKISEQIAIAVAQSNGCGYCLSAHTVIGKMHGLDVAALTAAKRSASTDPKTAAILKLAVGINQSRGQIDDDSEWRNRTEFLSGREASINDATIREDERRLFGLRADGGGG